MERLFSWMILVLLLVGVVPLVSAVHGVKVCGNSFDCGVSDGVCPEDYGADCSASLDPDCPGYVPPAGCVESVCNLKDVESDSGDKPLVNGYVKDAYCSGNKCVVPGPSYDSCNANTLTEYYLSGGVRRSKTYDCDGFDSESDDYCDGSKVVRDVYDYGCACTASNGCLCAKSTTTVVVEDCSQVDVSDECTVISVSGDVLTVNCPAYSCVDGGCEETGATTNQVVCDADSECSCYGDYTCRYTGGEYEWTSDLGVEFGVDCDDAHDNDCDTLVDGNDNTQCDEGDGGLGCSMLYFARAES